MSSFTPAQLAELAALLEPMNETLAKTTDGLAETASNATTIWILICGFLVFWMHAGFAMLEAGAVRAKNTVNILYKNLVTVAIGVIGYFFFGWAFAYGTDNVKNNSSKFIGSGNYALHDLGVDQYYSWFFQMVFAATCATIVSGAVAERTKLEMYFLASLYLVCFVYPIVSHWIWAEGGWLSAFTLGEDKIFYDSNSDNCGFIDFAGSTVVHLVGGVSGFVGAIIIGPRLGRFEILEDGKFGQVLPMPGHSLALSALGTFVLWFGWFGFNCGSTLAFDGNLAAHVAVTTAISPASATLFGTAVHYYRSGHFDLGVALNCALGGLVSITAGCATILPWKSIFVGMIGALFYIGCSNLMVRLKIDDPLDAVAVHGACGIWGTLAVGIFSDKESIYTAYGSVCPGAKEGTDYSLGWQFLTQFVGILAVVPWVALNAFFIFTVLNKTFGLRVSEEMETAGMDVSEHNTQAYELGMAGMPDGMAAKEKSFLLEETSKTSSGSANVQKDSMSGIALV